MVIDSLIVNNSGYNNKKNEIITLFVISIILAGVSVNFLIFGSLKIVEFSFYKNFFLIPAITTLFIIMIYAYYKIRPLFQNLITGLWIGVVATLGLELIRIPSYLLFNWLPGDDMIMMPGTLLLELATSPMEFMKIMNTNMEVVQSMIVGIFFVGTLYHFWNGATLGAIYTIFMGKGKWYYGIVWGFIIHIGMMLAPWLVMMFGPFGIKFGDGYNVFAASFFAHVIYGLILGILAQRFIKQGTFSLIKIKSRENK